MSTSEVWVPAAAFVEHFVLEEALVRDVTIAEASFTVVPRFGLRADGPFLHKETRLLGMLYTLLVFPYERWQRDGLIDDIVQRANADTELLYLDCKPLSAEFIRRMRNAVSHARIEFNEDTITLRDREGGASVPFEVTLSISEAVNFLLVLGRAFHGATQSKDYLAIVGRSKQ